MKYIITESQFKIAEQSIRYERLEKNIMEFFDEHLTPYGGWESPKSYRKDIEDFAPPIANPMNVHVYGTRYGELKSFF